MSRSDEQRLASALGVEFGNDRKPRAGAPHAFRTDREVAAALEAAVGKESVDDPAEMFAKLLGEHVDSSAPSGAELTRRIAAAKVEAQSRALRTSPGRRSERRIAAAKVEAQSAPDEAQAVDELRKLVEG